MEIINIKSVFPYLFGSVYIGHGKCAFCFKMRNGKVLKLFYNSYSKLELFSIYKDSITDFFSYISSFNNDTFYGPESLLMNDGNVVGYIMKLSPGVTLNRYRKGLTIDEFKIMCEKLFNDISVASLSNLRVGDIHQANLMISDRFSLIDLDKFYETDKHTPDKIMQFNIGDVMEIILQGIFNFPNNYEVKLDEEDLQKLYNHAKYFDYMDYFELLDELKKYGDETGQIRKSGVVYAKKIEPYNYKW